MVEVWEMKEGFYTALRILRVFREGFSRWSLDNDHSSSIGEDDEHCHLLLLR